VQAMFDAVIYSFEQADIYGKYNVDRFLGAFGLVVSKEYRGRNIATEIIKARPAVMRKIGVKVTATAFSVTGSQKAAERAGFEDVYVVR
jgi:GNAT superfamily N-acetyltransferase